MKNHQVFLIGTITGYLLTAGFVIPFPPVSFWYFFFGLIIIGIIIIRTYSRINDDIHPGDF